MQRLSTEQADKNNDLLALQDTITQLQENLKSEQQAAAGKVLIFLFDGADPNVQVKTMKFSLIQC